MIQGMGMESKSVRSVLRSVVAPGGVEQPYMMSVTIRSAFGQISLESESLKSSEVAAALRANGVRSRDTMPIFEVMVAGKKRSIDGVVQQLATMLDQIQDRYMVAGASRRWWFVAGDDLPVVQQKLQEMESERLILIEELRSCYEAARDMFELRLKNVLGAAGRDVEFDSYACKFPLMTAIESELRLEIDGPIRIPSVVEMALETPEMQQWMGRIREQLERDLPRLVDDICGTAADFLTRLDRVTPGNLTLTQAKGLAKTHDRLQSLYKLLRSMESVEVGHPALIMIRQVVTIGGLCNLSDTTVEKLTESLIEYRKVLKSSDFLGNVTKGSRALHEWVNGLSAEQRCKALIAEMQILQSELPKLSPQERQDQLSAFKTRAQSEAALMSGTAAQLLSLVDALILVGAQEPESESSIPNTAEDAGF